MSNPLALFPLALAAAGGCVDAFQTQQLVAAGLTLKQRSGALVRALAMGRSALLLPLSPAFFVGLAASDGSGALVIDAARSDDEISWQLADANVRAVFTMSALAGRLGAFPTIVLLDEAPFKARVLGAGRTVDVDLGSHHGLALEGDQTVAGRDEECVLFYERADDGGSRRITLTHRALLAWARTEAAARKVESVEYVTSSSWSNSAALIRAAAVLLSGARVETGARAEATSEYTATDHHGITHSN